MFINSKNVFAKSKIVHQFQKCSRIQKIVCELKNAHKLKIVHGFQKKFVKKCSCVQIKFVKSKNVHE